MEKEILQEQIEVRLAEAKARYVNSIVRTAYTDSESILYVQDKIKSGLEFLEGYLTQEYIGFGDKYEIMNCETKQR